MIERRPVIRHIATFYDSPVIAVADFERYVQIWDIDSQRRIADLETTLDFGGNRLAITRDGQHCAVGAYHIHGVALYETKDGTEVWRRKDLKKVQSIRASVDGQRLLCGFEGKSFELLDVKTGRSKPSLRGVKDVFESVYDDLMIIDTKGRDFKLANAANKQIATVPRTTFAALGFAFAPGKLCITESGGSTRCYDTRTGKELWEHNPGNGIHALDLTYDESTQMFAAITWPYQKGGEHQLVTLHPDDGEAVRRTAITGAHEFAFCSNGSAFITSDGKIRNTATAEVKGVLNFFPFTEKAC